MAKGTWYLVLTGASQQPEPFVRLKKGQPAPLPKRSEFKAKFQLEMQGFHVFLPYEIETKKRKARGRDQQVIVQNKLPLFGRYIFVRAGEGQTVHQINNTPFVSTVLYTGDRPVVVPEDVMRELRDNVDWTGSAGTVDRTVRQRYKPGDILVPTCGPAYDYNIVALANFTELLEYRVKRDEGNAIEVWCDHLKLVAGKTIKVSPETVDLKRVG